MSFKIYIFCINIAICCAAIKVPPGLKFGAATAAYQVEGGWNASGKSANIWDTYTHTYPSLILDGSTGDVACDSYHLWEEDIKNLKFIGVDFYRFSLSWSRILPTGFTNKINPDGVRYYNNIIDGLIKSGIEPMVTLYHWDLPQPIQDLGGWTNPQIAEYFGDFAQLCFQLFGDRVKRWITINEPHSICPDIYDNGQGAPNVKSRGIGTYLCGKTLLLAHARAYHVYNKHFKSVQSGKIGITIDSNWYEPKTNNSEDIEAAERTLQMIFGWWAHPIFSKDGDYPEIMKSRIGNISKLENFTESRLPPLTPHEIKMLRGSADFLGLNNYRSLETSAKKFDLTEPTSFAKDLGIDSGLNPNWKPSPRITGWGFRKLINWIKNQYDNPLIYITENGIEDTTGTLDDQQRIAFLKDYMTQLFLAITEDGCNVKRYTVWSIMDNMEWKSGYTLKFGIYRVDFNSPNRTRTPKASAMFYKDVIKKRKLD